MTTETTDVLVEITSTHNLEFCKKLMEDLLNEIINLNLSMVNEKNESLKALTVKMADLKTNDEEVTDEQKPKQTLIVQQVKITDSKGSLKCVYPSRVDLGFGGSKAIRVSRLYND
jgi:hypothetical protein